MGVSQKLNRIFTAARCFHGLHDDLPIVKLIKSDGGVEIYDRPIKAWELMEEYPKHMVCRSDSFYIGQKTPALSGNDRLRPGHCYFLFPANFFQTALSFASFLRCRSPLPSFEIEKTAAGTLRIKVTEEIIRRQIEEAQKMIRVCTTPQLQKEYEQLVAVRRRHHWKPVLETVPEKGKKKRKKKRRSGN